jgi:glycosyltransferase involved in cell wall biosynthesis
MSSASPTPCDLTIVIACFNEAPHLAESVAEIDAVMARTNTSYELLFIDDCSLDGTRDVIKRLVADQVSGLPRSFVFHEKNVGRGGTVREGILMSRSAIAGFLDIDLEVRAEHIPRMLQALEAGADVATAKRHSSFGWSWKSLHRYILSRGYLTVFRLLLRTPLKDTETGYKFFRREAILPVLQETETKGWFWDTEVMVLAWLHGLDIQELPCPFTRRAEKKSTVKVLSVVREYLTSILSFRKRIQGRTRKPNSV